MTINKAKAIINGLKAEIGKLEKQKEDAEILIKNLDQQIARKKEQLEALDVVKDLFDENYDITKQEVGFGLGKKLPDEVKQKMKIAQQKRQEEKRQAVIDGIEDALRKNGQMSLNEIADAIHLTTYFTRRHLRNNTELFKEVKSNIWKLK